MKQLGLCNQRWNTENISISSSKLTRFLRVNVSTHAIVTMNISQFISLFFVSRSEMEDIAAFARCKSEIYALWIICRKDRPTLSNKDKKYPH
jgi:hypothetical protein